jgi:hypothetical protein
MSVASAIKTWGQGLINTIGSPIKGLKMPIHGTINVAGELVQIDEAGFNPKQYYDRVSFREGYFPEKDATELKAATELFKRVFSGDKPISIENPLPPCNEGERKILLDGLKNRFVTLADEISMIENIEHDKEMLRTKISQLDSLKQFIFLIKENIVNDSCNIYDEGLGGKLNIDDAQANDDLRNMLRRFVIYTLQHTKGLDEYVDPYTKEAGQVVPILDQEPLTADELTTYVNKWRRINKSEIPSIIIEILGITGEDTNLINDKVKGELEKVRELMRQSLMAGGGEQEGESITDTKRELQDILNTTPDAKVMVTKFTNYIVTKLESAQDTIDSLTSEMQGYKQEILGLKEKLASTKQMVVFSTQTVSEMLEAKNAAEAKVAGLTASDEEKAALLQSMKATYENSLAAAQKMNEDLLNRQQVTQTALEVAEGNFDLTQKNIGQKTIEANTLKIENDSLTQQLKATLAEILTFQNQVKSQQELLTLSFGEKAALQEQVDAMKAQLDAALQKAAVAMPIPQAGGGPLENRILELESQLSIARDSYQRDTGVTKEENVALKVQINGLEQEIEKARLEQGSSKCRACADQHTELDTINKRLLALTAEAGDKDKQIVTLTLAKGKCDSILVAEMAAHDAEIQSKIDEITAVKESNKAAIDALNAEKATLVKQIDADKLMLKKQRDKMQGQLASIRRYSGLLSVCESSLSSAKAAAEAAAKTSERAIAAAKSSGKALGTTRGMAKAVAAAIAAAKAVRAGDGAAKVAEAAKAANPAITEKVDAAVNAGESPAQIAAIAEAAAVPAPAPATAAIAAEKAVAAGEGAAEVAEAAKAADPAIADKVDAAVNAGESPAQIAAIAEAAATAPPASLEGTPQGITCESATKDLDNLGRAITKRQLSTGKFTKTPEEEAQTENLLEVKRKACPVPDGDVAPIPVDTSRRGQSPESAAPKSVAEALRKKQKKPLSVAERLAAIRTGEARKAAADARLSGQILGQAKAAREAREARAANPSSRSTTPTPKPASRSTTPSRKPFSRSTTPTPKPASRSTTPTPKPASRSTTPSRKPFSRSTTPTPKPASRSTTPIKQTTYTMIGASHTNTIRAILDQIKRGNGAALQDVIKEDIQSMSPTDRSSLETSPIAKLITEYKSNSSFFNSSKLAQQPPPDGDKANTAYYQQVWSDIRSALVKKPNPNKFLRDFICKLFKAYVEQYNIGDLPPTATPQEKAPQVLPFFKQYIGDIKLFKAATNPAAGIEKQTLYKMLNITDAKLTGYLSTGIIPI